MENFVILSGILALLALVSIAVVKYNYKKQHKAPR